MPKEYYKGRDHKERSQPASRQKFGFLEKHKDYVKRAKDYHRKTDAIKRLRTQAALRHPDEFAYGMISAKTDEEGMPIKVNDKMPTKAEQKASNRANRGYLQMALAVDKKNIERLEGTLCNLSRAGAHNKQTFFADDAAEAKLLRQTKAKREIGVPTIRSNKVNERRLELETQKQQHMLQERKKRAKHLSKLLNYLEFEKNKMAKGKKRIFKHKNGNHTIRFEAKRLR